MDAMTLMDAAALLLFVLVTSFGLAVLCVGLGLMFSCPDCPLRAWIRGFILLSSLTTLIWGVGHLLWLSQEQSFFIAIYHPEAMLQAGLGLLFQATVLLGDFLLWKFSAWHEHIQHLEEREVKMREQIASLETQVLELNTFSVTGQFERASLSSPMAETNATSGS